MGELALLAATNRPCTSFGFAYYLKMHWLEGTEGIERDTELLEWLHLALVTEHQPEVSS
jgi:hypothetical protein